MNPCIYYAQELLKILYPNTTIDAKMGEQAALAAVGQACDEVRKRQYLQSLGEGDMIPYGWLSHFGEQNDKSVEILKTNKGEYYCELPARVIQINDVGGIRTVYPTGCPQNLIYPTPTSFRGMFNTSEVKNLGGRMGFSPKQDRLYFLQDMSKYKSVDMDLFAQAQSLDEDDPFPADDSIINLIMERATQLWGTQKQIPADPVNNGISQ